MRTPKLERASPDVRVLKPPTVEWQSACCLILWKLGYGDGRPLRIEAADMAEMVRHFDGGPVIHDHADRDHVTYRIITKEQARAEGLLR